MRQWLYPAVAGVILMILMFIAFVSTAGKGEEGEKEHFHAEGSLSGAVYRGRIAYSSLQSGRPATQ